MEITLNLEIVNLSDNDLNVILAVSGSVSTAHSGEEGSVQIIGEVHSVVFKETRRHETPSATSPGCAFT